MKIEFLASVAVITPDPPASRKLYVDALGLPLGSQSGDEYIHTDQLGDAKRLEVAVQQRSGVKGKVTHRDLAVAGQEAAAQARNN